MVTGHNNNLTNLVRDSIALADVHYCVEGKKILSSITVETFASRVGIVGRNGSGKSTLVRLISGLISPNSGTARVHGKNLAKDRKSALTEIGILFQNPDHQIIFPTVEEEISFGLRQMGNNKADAQAQTNAVLSAFGKEHWCEAYISSLSQGQKHLVCLMSVMAMRPRTIILDEPFSGLDIPTKIQLKRYLSQYSGRLVHVTHEPSDIAQYEHVIWLELGEIAAEGNAEDILPRYSTAMKTLGGSDDISNLTH